MHQIKCKSSVLSAEFKVTASVLTRDIYQRIFRKNATPSDLIEVIVCIVVFLGLGFFLTKDIAYNERVTAFFKKLSTPAPIEAESYSSVIEGLMGLYAIAFLVRVRCLFLWEFHTLKILVVNWQ